MSDKLSDHNRRPTNHHHAMTLSIYRNSPAPLSLVYWAVSLEILVTKDPLVVSGDQTIQIQIIHIQQIFITIHYNVHNSESSDWWKIEESSILFFNDLCPKAREYLNTHYLERSQIQLLFTFFISFSISYDWHWHQYWYGSWITFLLAGTVNLTPSSWFLQRSGLV